MRKQNFAEEQIAFVLKQVELGAPVTVRPGDSRKLGFAIRNLKFVPVEANLNSGRKK